jgi:hypothetical protein
MNSKKAITLLVLITMLMSMVPLVPVHALTVDATDGTYEVGDKILVSGTDVTAGATVTVYWDAVQAWDGEAGALNSTKAKANGNWECNITVPEAVWGEHYIWGKDISTGETDHDGTAVLVKTSLEFDPSSGLKGDDVDIIGHGFNDTVDITSIEYFNGTANITLPTTPSTPETDDVGMWTASFELPDLPYGDYNVTAYEEDLVLWATENFTIGAAIELSKRAGPEGSLVEIDGRGFTNGKTIGAIYSTVTLDGTNCTVETGDTIGTNGLFTIEVIVPSLGKGEDLKFNVSDGVVWATAKFDIDGVTKVIVTPTYGVQGSTVTIEGFNYSQVDEAEVVVELWNEANASKVVDIDEFETDDMESLVQLSSFQHKAMVNILYVHTSQITVSAML